MSATRTLVIAALGLSALSLTGCVTEPPATAQQQQALSSESRAALDKMYARDPGLRDVVDHAYAYAIFPSIGKGGLIVGGSSGRGEVYEQGRLVGYATLNSASVGAQIGGQELSELILFENQLALHMFENAENSVTLNASAVALKAGASGEAQFKNGVMIFTLPTGGLMAEASVAGQSFRFHPLDSSYDANTRTDYDRTRHDVDVNANVNTDTNQPHGHTEYRRTETEIQRNNP